MVYTKIKYTDQFYSDLFDILQSNYRPKGFKKKLRDVSDTLSRFPLSGEAYEPECPKKYSWRKVVVGDFIMFYHVDAASGVHVCRLIRGTMNYDRFLESTRISSRKFIVYASRH